MHNPAAIDVIARALADPSTDGTTRDTAHGILKELESAGLVVAAVSNREVRREALGHAVATCGRTADPNQVTEAAAKFAEFLAGVATPD